MIDRRAVIAGGGGLLAAATTAFGQTPLPKGRIGYLHPHSLSAATYVHMEPVWRKLGYVDGETVLLRYAAGDLNRIPVLIDELIAAGADVLILVGPQAVRAAHMANISVPIVAVDLESDPLREGFAQSFGRPRGNITGLFMDFPDLAAKWLQLLKEFAPAINL
jgi:putative ABC transport system substrate-binding protein